MNTTLQLDTTLYVSSINFNGYQDSFWNEVYASTSAGGKFAIDLGRKFNPNRFISRDASIWTNPWPMEIIPQYKMPEYDATFSLTFSEVSDTRALGFKERIAAGEKFAVMYSGGFDSTSVMVALLRNLTSVELESICVATSIQALIENPEFWRRFIVGKFKILDTLSHKYDDIINLGYTPISADDGDCMFGTVFGLNLYHTWENVAVNNKLSENSKSHIAKLMPKFNDPEVHYTEFKDLLIAYFSTIKGALASNPEFGKLLYDKFHLNAQTTTVPVNSLHDFFWWLIFNVKMLNCCVRGALYFNDTLPPAESIPRVENWFSDHLFQHWSMTNNGNGEKIGNSAATYKKAIRDYIYNFDKNQWYHAFKLKLESMGQIVFRQDIKLELPLGVPSSRFGVTKEYDMLSIDAPDVKDYIRYHLENFQIDWSD